MTAAEQKGNKVKLSTFSNWGFSNVIGFKKVVEDEETFVNFVWCKLCAKFEKKVLLHPSVKGASKKSIETYIKGTNVVTKYNLERHVKTKAHEAALELQKNHSDEDFVIESTGPSQPRIDIITSKQSRDAYSKLLRTAYELALNSTMSLSHFATLVKVQRINGVRLIEGKHDSRSARKLLNSIQTAVIEELNNIIKKSNFFSVLTDGSQARKTGEDKELVMVKAERKGEPVYMLVALLQMSNFGGCSAESLKAAIDSVFTENGQIPCEQYTKKLISCTSDGASVNTGRIEGLLTRLEEDGRDWLVRVHCVNHRVELAVKDAIGGEFDTVERLYMGIFNLLKNSGAIKSDISNAAVALNICKYQLPKVTGTRFVNHRCKAFSRLLNMWPAITKALENTLVVRKHKSETKAKIEGLLKQLHDYRILCLTCTYLDVLEKISSASLVFEGNGLLAFEIKNTIDLTILELEEIIESAETPDELLDSHLVRYQFTGEGEEKQLFSNFTKLDNNLKKLENQEMETIELENMKNLNNNSLTKASEAKRMVAIRLVEALKTRFTCFNDEIFQSMKWFDPKNWFDSPEYGETQLRTIITRFKTPLQETSFDETKVFREWKRFKLFVRSHYMDALCNDGINCIQIWKKVFQYRRSEFNSVCLLAEIVMVQSGSNSNVERAFSTLTCLMSNRRLKLKNRTIEMLMTLKINDALWDENDRNRIIERATEIHLSSKRKKKIDEPPSKVARIEIATSESEDEDDSDKEEYVDTSEEEPEDEELVCL